MSVHLKADVSLSQFAMIDVQSRLATAMPDDAMQAVIRNCSILVQACRLLNVPMIVTEQYPKGLGRTVPELSALIPDITPVEKAAFSCMAEPKFHRQLTQDHVQIVLAGSIQ